VRSDEVWFYVVFFWFILSCRISVFDDLYFIDLVVVL